MALEDDIEVLQRIPFFEGVSPEHLRLVASSAETRSLPEKLLLYDEGQLLHSAYVIISGNLSGEKKAKAAPGSEPRAIGPGSMLGARALVLDIRATESVRVVSRARVLQIRKAAFRRLLQDQPGIAVALRARLMREVIQVSAEFETIAQRLREMPG